MLKRWISIMWFIVPIMGVVPKILLGPDKYNNYLIYIYTFWHSWNHESLYGLYPQLYFDQNHYGPTFSAIIAPFALLPNPIGILLWSLVSVAFMYFAIQKLPIDNRGKNGVMAIVLIELVGTVQNQQFNTIICASILLTFVYLYESKIPAAAFMIAGGFLVKLYGLVGLAFVPYSGKYKQMLNWLIIATLILFALPMIWAGPSFIWQSYGEWFARLLIKNQENIQNSVNGGMQDISFMGLVKRTTGAYTLSNLWFHIPAAMLMLMPLLKKKYHHDLSYQFTYLAQVMIGLVIFSTSAESPTYIIAVTGFAIWYVQWKGQRPKWLQGLLVLIIMLTILSSTDLYPRSIRQEVIVRYALKALPCVVAWFAISWKLLFFKEVDAGTT